MLVACHLMKRLAHVQDNSSRAGEKAAAARQHQESMTSPFKNAPPPRDEQQSARPSKAQVRVSKANKVKDGEDAALAPKSTEMFAHLPQYKVRRRVDWCSCMF